MDTALPALTPMQESLFLTFCGRALDYDIVANFVTRYPDAVALHLGVGLDTRIFPVKPPSTVA